MVSFILVHSMVNFIRFAVMLILTLIANLVTLNLNADI